MKRIKETLLAFLASYGFFQFAYPYHIIRREQMNLFVYDWDYIRQTYRGTGWFARFVSDFLEQFFHLPVIGPLVIALLLTGIGVVVYRICRHWLGKWPSLAVAAAFYLWSFLRETGNLYTTRYTVVALGFLSLILLALQCKKRWLQPVAALLLVAFGAWALGSPFHKHYGKPWGFPRFEYDRVIALDAETAREHWDKVLKLSKKDLYMVEASYCYNLAHAMKGDLGDWLYSHSQAGPFDLLPRVDAEQTLFTNCLAGEAWFHLGNITVAEQSAIIALQASPDHTGVRFLKRLAEVNLISGEDAAAQKYLNLLRKTLFYGKWARRRMPGRQDREIRDRIAEARKNLSHDDFIHHSDVPRDILLNLLEANPANKLARNYLLCFDLMRYDLDQFMEDYTPDMIKARLYHEAVLIWLDERMTEATAARYGVDASTINRMQLFFRNPDKYPNTYWYHYLNALYESNR